MATPGKPRPSGIPGIGSRLPTPGRPRSASTVSQPGSAPAHDADFAARAFQAAVKANDPAQHRSAPRASDASSVALSPSFSQTGRRSVASRPTSVSSHYSASTRAPAPRAKTPTARPASRQSDVFARSTSRAGRSVDIGDMVRIESLGFEGTLRYLGEIDGKPGMWAGVELGGGFAGKGKNNGSVAGKSYFLCPNNCGVFVATTKLSPATTGSDAISRPSSVASVRGGRVTPSFSKSGRVTPSFSKSGRITPSMSTTSYSGRITPSASTSSRMSYGRMTPSASTSRITPGKTPSARLHNQRPAPIPKPNFGAPTASSAGDTTITPGSRASKYLGMTAKQLTARDSSGGAGKLPGFGSPSRVNNARSSSASSGTASPSRSSYSSPFNTPRPPPATASGIGLGLGTPSKSRTPLTPRTARIPSAISMPPPPSPSASSRIVSLNDVNGDNRPKSSADLSHDARALQDRIDQLLLNGRVTPSSNIGGGLSPRPGSSASAFSANETAHWQAQVDALLHENRRLETELAAKDAQAAVGAEAEKEAVQRRASELEASLRTAERAVTEREGRLEALARDVAAARAGEDKARAEGESRARELGGKLEDAEALVGQLKEALEAKSGAEAESGAVLGAKDAEIEMLRARAQKAYAELEEERRELGAQVEELRQAGQETIALYEERLSISDTRRYELEDRIVVLEEQARRPAAPASPGAVARRAESAAEIDNESLRGEVQHLQKRIASLEDALEEARAGAERDEAQVVEKIRRYKEKEEGARKELGEGRKEVERLVKAEAGARARMEEMEEAVREGAVALENARAEIEALRAEITDLESKAADGEAGESGDRVAEAAQRTANERARAAEEIAKFKELLEEARVSKRELVEQLELGKLEADEAAKMLVDLKQSLEDAELDKDQLTDQLENLQSKLEQEIALRQTADDRTAELEAAKKKLNRDVTMNNGVQEHAKAHSPSPSLAAAKEELRGLKILVQELQKENSAVTQQLKLYESENKILMTETDQLRQELKMLEENVEQSLLREERALDSPSPMVDDVAALQKTIKDLKTRHELEIEQLRKRQADAEIKNARTIHELNKDISELESLVESKIYREDELERELEKTKDKLNRAKKSSRAEGMEMSESASIRSVKSRASISSVASAATAPRPPSPPANGDGEVCEICEQPGHDIFTCKVLAGDGADADAGGDLDLDLDLDLDMDLGEEISVPTCGDCGERGHRTEACPHALDVF